MLRHEFREDLYFRISTFTLRVLPLAQRPMDILPLAAHVLQQHGTPGTPYRITDEARRRLLAYHWPGNVRELGNVIQRALVLCPDRTLTEDHLLFDDDVFAGTAGLPSFEVSTSAPSDAAVNTASALTIEVPSASTQAVEPSGGAGLQWAVRHSELRVIQDAIRNTSSREAAARLLGISPRTLRYKLAQMRDLGMMTAESVG
jgi:two-component system response regulator FlrC